KLLSGQIAVRTLALWVCLVPCLAIAQAPPQAAAVGYTLNTFSSNFARSGVDFADTRRPGLQWYLWHFFGFRTTNVNTLQYNADGSLTLLGDNNSKGGNLAT